MTTTTSQRSIFRDSALQKYVQGREKSVLPRFVAPPVFAFCWLILAALTGAGGVAWLGQVPLYATGSGVILDTRPATTQGNDEAVAVILLPAPLQKQLRTGSPVQLQIGPRGPSLMRTIDTIDPGLLSPSEVRQRYRLEVLEPSFLATSRLGPALSSRLYAGSRVQAQVQVGSERLLALFPLFNTLLS
jgi:hypothetical protein